jgi:hypothetical protein
MTISVDVVKDSWDYLAIAVAGAAGLGTVAAVVVAVLDARRANERADRAEAALKEHNASRVTFSVYYPPGYLGGPHAELVVRNKGAMPVFDIRPVPEDHGGEVLIRNGGTQILELSAGQTAHIPIDLGAAGVNATVDNVRVGIRFTDDADLRWLRTSAGDLQRVDKELNSTPYN